MATKKVVCDTDVMIDYFDSKKPRRVTTKITLEDLGLDNVVLSAITKMELIVGAIDKTDLIKTTKKFDRFSTALIDQDVTLQAIALIGKYSLSHGLEIPDCIIAATVIANDLELFTYNIKDYRFIDGLSFFSP